MQDLFIITLIATTLRVATPLLLATIGELFCERSGILNLGIEGTLFFGAYIGFYFADITGSLWLGILAALIGGMLAGLVMGFLTITLGVNQHVSGLGMTMLLEGLSFFWFRVFYGKPSVPPAIKGFDIISAFKDIPILGPITEQYLLTYLTFIVLVPAAWYLLYRTSFGLKLRSVGENPEAADAAGINVFRTRYIALMLGGALMSMGGAFISLAQMGSFTFGIISGRGWVAIALVVFSNWDPIRALLASILFGGVFALQVRLQTMGSMIPYEFFLSLPYLVTIAALALAGRNAAYPGALLKPYKRE
jgi:general nucleoside transport system permease protein